MYQQDTFLSSTSIIRMGIISFDLIWRVLIISNLCKNVWTRKMYHLLSVKMIFQTYRKLIQSKQFWTLLEQKVYENKWEAKNLDVLVRTIKQKSKELDLKMLQDMVDGVGRKLRAMCRERLHSVLWTTVLVAFFVLFLMKTKTRPLASKTIEL